MQGKVVLVSGGARRVGSAVCRALHARGARLMIHYRRSGADAAELAAQLNHVRPGSATVAQADLLDTAQGIPRLIETTLATFGRLDGLVQNASSFYPTPVGRIGEDSWNDLIGTNLKGPLFLAQAAATPLMESRGCIVNIIDIHADRPLKGYVVYSVAKAGLAGLTRSLAVELGPAVRVNGVAPGPVLWPEDDINFDPAERERILSQTALRRSGTPEDIAGAVTFLVYDAPYITGQILAVDGGRSIHL